MRADIAAILDQPTSLVEDGVNLLDLGLDSLRIMELADRWSQASGVFVDFAMLAEEPEVTAWWGLISDRTG
ncbi:MAG: phosphopantetheine-binding protein [Gemmatimonadetes bacterium]|nr:phosphopantetheine-binding protein [Gemmatimonadota bacterium]